MMNTAGKLLLRFFFPTSIAFGAPVSACDLYFDFLNGDVQAFELRRGADSERVLEQCSVPGVLAVLRGSGGVSSLELDILQRSHPGTDPFVDLEYLRVVISEDRLSPIQLVHLQQIIQAILLGHVRAGNEERLKYYRPVYTNLFIQGVGQVAESGSLNSLSAVKEAGEATSEFATAVCFVNLDDPLVDVEVVLRSHRFEECLREQ